MHTYRPLCMRKLCANHAQTMRRLRTKRTRKTKGQKKREARGERAERAERVEWGKKEERGESKGEIEGREGGLPMLFGQRTSHRINVNSKTVELVLL